MYFLFPENLPYLSEDENFIFPQANESDSRPIICRGGNLSPGMLISGYKQGFFPWFNEGEPIRWWNPSPRFVLLPKNLHISKSLEKEIKRNEKKLEANSPDAIILKTDTAFREVIENCASMKRTDQDGTWITQEMIEAYCKLHELGYAHSFEAWTTIDGKEELVGGFYGERLGKAFFGESMFMKVSDAAKIVFAKFARAFFADGGKFIDCQVYTENMDRYGATNISRSAYMRLLNDALE